jgi:hypothetical protein
LASNWKFSFEFLLDAFESPLRNFRPMRRVRTVEVTELRFHTAGDVTAAASEIPFPAEVIVTAGLERKH